ncbi:hypothetical protein IJ472_06715 [bacterium]|nr:hypothetical protein [bacterium]
MLADKDGNYTCSCCGHVGPDDDFVIYGGSQKYDYNFCRKCQNKISSFKYQQLYAQLHYLQQK